MQGVEHSFATVGCARATRLGAASWVGVLLSLSVPLAAAGQTVTLYQNDFEHPNKPIAIDCGNSLDQGGINALYGSDGIQYLEQFTVEVVSLHDAESLYSNQGTANGDYAIGMLGSVQDDRLALRFDTKGRRFIKLAMDVSSIDVRECGGPFGLYPPAFKISLVDTPKGSFTWESRVLDEKVLAGHAASSAWAFEWTRGEVALDLDGTTDGNVALIFDLTSEGYAAFDNLTITAGEEQAITDQDKDGVADSSDNCVTTPNPDQANIDVDALGDACDPAPEDPRFCGDKDDDGSDDCRDWCETHPVKSCSEPVSKAGAGGRASEPDAGRAAPPEGGSSGSEDRGAAGTQTQTSPVKTGAGGAGGSGKNAATDSKSSAKDSGCGAVRLSSDRPAHLLPLCLVCLLAWRRARRVRNQG